MLSNSQIESLTTEIINCLPRAAFRNYSDRVLDLRETNLSLLANNCQEVFNIVNRLDDIDDTNDKLLNTTDIPEVTIDTEFEISTETSAMRIGKYLLLPATFVLLRCSSDPRVAFIHMLIELFERLSLGDTESSYKLLRMLSKEKKNMLAEYNTLDNDNATFQPYGEIKPCQI